VVCPAGRPLSTVQVRTESGLVAATVAWHRLEGDVDVALLVVTDPGWSVPQWRHPVRWGRLVTTRSGQQCKATGFPTAVAQPQCRDSHPAIGVINPEALVKAGLYGIEVTNFPAGPNADGSRWQGMSGAAVMCDDLLVGVVTADPAGFDSRRLVAVPITTVTADPRFAELVAAHTGAAPIVEPVELARLSEPVVAPESPAGLLRADAANTPFRPRPELAQLHEWCHDPAWSATRLVVGTGGQGKTRLARHLAAQLAADGWATVMLAESAGPDDVAVLGEVAVPTLVIVDYAEGRTHQLDALVQALARAEAKVRLLLLARTAGAWRTERVDPLPHLAVLADDRIVLELGPVEPTPEGRGRAWEQALVTLASQLEDLDGYRDIAWTTLAAQLTTPTLDGDRYRTILAVQMHALAALLQAGDPISTADGEAQDVLLAHESRYWSRVAKRFEIPLTPATRQCLVATATLWSATDGHDARQVLTAILPTADRDALSNTADWLATLYQDNERYWSGLQPDLLAEHLIGTVLGPNGRCPTLITDTISGASTAQMEHGLTLLGRAHPHYPHLTQTITDAVLSAGTPGGAAAITVAPRLAHPQPLLTALERLIQTADLPTLQALNSALPHYSMLLTPISLNLTTALVTLLREAAKSNRDANLPDLARSVHNLASRLAETGQRTEGLITAQEAVDLRRELVTLNRDAYLPDLAGSVNNLAVRLGEAGQRTEALTTAHDAVGLYRELTALNRDAYLPDLAKSLNNLARYLAEAGQRTEALTTAHDAVKLRRELVMLNRDAYLPDLAIPLNNLANYLAEAGQRTEALTTAQEALDLRRELVALNRDAYLPDLALSLNNLAHQLSEAGQRTEALTTAHDAVKLRRELVTLNRDAYLPDLASSVNDLANYLAEAGQRTEALTTAHDAVKLRRELVMLNRDAYLPTLAMSLNNLAVRLAEAGQRTEALTTAQEALDLYRELVTLNRDAYLPDLAGSVNNLANHLAKAGQRAEALTTAQEALDLSRELTALNRDAYLPDLAGSVNNLASRLAEAGQRTEALTTAQDAVELYRELATLNRDAYLPNLAGAVNNLALLLAEAGRRTEALTTAQKALDLGRELAALNRDAYLPNLAMSLNNLAHRLTEAGQRTEALTTAQDAVELYRELATLNRDAYLPDLAESVNNLANRLAETEQREQAVALAREASAHYHDLARTNPDVYGPAAERADGFVTTLVKNES